jgi:putative sterol carrier protein
MLDFFLDAPTQDAVQSGGAAPESGSIASLFTKIEKYITPEVLEKTGATFQFDVVGEEAGTWFIDLKNAPGKAGKGKPDFIPDATLTMDSKDFFNMLSGQLKPANAFLGGKLKISGDMRKAMKMEKLMSALKTKSKL